MSAYLKFYSLERSPFEAEAQSKVVLGTKALRDALAAVRAGLEEGAARICVSGQAGLGKTSLARALPKLLDESARVAVVLHPSTSWNSIRSSIAKQWKIGEGGLARSNLLSFAIETKLVLVVDQAETASTDILDHLDVLLSYRTEEDQPVVQSILFANLTPQADEEPPPLIWWLDRIQTLELQFAPLPREGVGSYIQKHLKRAGWQEGSLFTEEASHAIHGYTGGIPGEVDRVCERLLVEAAAQNLSAIEVDFVHAQLDDQADENTNHYDTFEELVMEDEFKGAAEASEEDAERPSDEPPSLQETLTHFAAADPEPEADPDASLDSNAEAESSSTDVPNEFEFVEQIGSIQDASGTGEAPDDPYAEESDEENALSLEDMGATEMPTLELVDEAATAPSKNDSEKKTETRVTADQGYPAIDELEDYLSQPASEEELRMLRGGRFGPSLRAAAMLAVALTIGGLLAHWIGGDDSEPALADQSAIGEQSPETPISLSNPTIFATSDGLAVDPAGPPLARLRGPVRPNEELGSPDSAKRPPNAADGLTRRRDETANAVGAVPAAPGSY